MPRSMRTLVYICAATWAAACCGQEPSDANPDRDKRDRRMDLLWQRVVALKARGPEDEEQLFGQDPVLRYNDRPRGVVDASVWVLGQEGRPLAVLVLEVYDNNTVMYEVTASDNPPKSVQANGWQWSPRRSDFAWNKIPIAVIQDQTPRLRQRQLRLLTQDFAASEEFNGQTYPLRLMPRPIHQYEDENRGVLDGAIFVWAHGTNAEILMFVEARQEEDSQPYWLAGFSRLATASLDVTFQQKDFWSSPRQEGDAYFSRSDRLTGEEQIAFAID